jgi:integrase
MTFETKQDADAWLRAHRRGDHDNTLGVAGDPLLRDYAEQWLRTRVTKGRALKPRTRADYEKLLERLILPAFGDRRLTAITPAMVKGWHASLDASKPTLRARAYGLLQTIMRSAVEEDDIALGASPCQVKGAGHVEPAHASRPATLEELETIVAALPPRYRAMALLAAWCGLRFGELTELRRKDVHDGAVHVTRGVVRAGGAPIVGDPKSVAGKRRVALPPHLRPVLEQHLADHVGAQPTALLFPARRNGGHMAPASLYRVWYPARAKAGREDLRFHDLRHTGATLAAATGATIAELMARIGHSTPAAAMRYQHAAQEGDERIAEALSGFALAGAVSLKAPASKRAVRRIPT